MIKKILTILVILFSIFSASNAQLAVDNVIALASPSKSSQQIALKVFPNPATNYIGLTKTDGVSELRLYNAVGRLVKSIPIVPDEKYSITDIPSGMYLVQFVDEQSKVITTQRLHKR